MNLSSMQPWNIGGEGVRQGRRDGDDIGGHEALELCLCRSMARVQCVMAGSTVCAFWRGLCYKVKKKKNITTLYMFCHEFYRFIAILIDRYIFCLNCQQIVNKKGFLSL